MDKDNIASFWGWVEKRYKDVGIASIAELERMSDSSNGLIRNRKNDLKLPTVEMAVGLCKALEVSWIELWTHAGHVKETDMITPPASLSGLDEEIFRELSKTNDEFKQIVLETIRLWTILYNKLNKG